MEWQGPRKAPGLFGDVERRGWGTGTVRGDTQGHWAYVLRASLKVQSSFDFWDFVGFIPLAQRRLGR